MTRRRLFAPRLAGLLILVVAAGVVGLHLVDGPSAASGPQILVRDARGALAIDQSKAGRAIVKGDNLRPGAVVRGRTKVENAGGSSARITLSGDDLNATIGPDGVAFSDVLALRVRKRTLRNPRVGPRTLYEGTLGGMPAVKLGVWRPGGHHRYTFRVQYPGGETARGDSNAWQGSSASIGFTWAASPGH